MEFSLSKPQTVSYWCVHSVFYWSAWGSDSEVIRTPLYQSSSSLRTHGVDTKHSQAFSAGHSTSKASNFQTEVSKVGDTSQDEQLFTELEKALDREEMDDEAFVDKLGCEIDI